MGSELSQEALEKSSLDLLQTASQNPCLLPDLGIDESLMKYSGVNSQAELQDFSSELLAKVPDFVSSLGSSVGGATSFPNAVGLGALVISMIMEIVVKSHTAAGEDSSGLLRRVFGEEKASAVRDTMSEYLTRHRTFISNEQRLLAELLRLEQQLSSHLTVLRNSLLLDGQMNTRGFKIWINGAAFRVQMLIHEARLNIHAGKQASSYTAPIRTAIDVYLQDVDKLLDKYKALDHKVKIYLSANCYIDTCLETECIIESDQCKRAHDMQIGGYYCGGSELRELFMKKVFSNYEPISGLKSYFSNIKSNVETLIRQHDSFVLPARA